MGVAVVEVAEVAGAVVVAVAAVVASRLFNCSLHSQEYRLAFFMTFEKFFFFTVLQLFFFMTIW